jgi:predicted dehydrogenase
MSSDYSKVSVAIVGCGGMGGVHASNYKLNGAKIVAVADENIEAAKKMAETYQCKYYGNYKEMFEKEKLTVVSICTPPTLHYKVAMDAFKKKINVFSEKPLTVTVAEAKKMVDAAKKNKVLFGVGYCHRFQWQVRQVKTWLDKGMFGKIVMYQNRFAGFFDGVENRWFSKKEISGGGMILDTLTHSMDLFRYLVGEAKTVKASICTHNPKIKVDDTAILMLQTKDGAIATLEGSWYMPFTFNTIALYGTKGAAIINYNTNDITYMFEGDADWSVMKMKTNEKDRFFLEFQAFLNAVVNKKTPPVNGVDGLKAMEIYEAALKSAK